MRVMIGFLDLGKVRIRVRVGVTFNVSVYHCHTSKCCTFCVLYEEKRSLQIDRTIARKVPKINFCECLQAFLVLYIFNSILNVSGQYQRITL